MAALAGGLIGAWALRVAREGSAHVAALRDRAGIETCTHAGQTWLRGACADRALWLLLAAVPGGERFVVDDAGRCRVPGRSLPTAQLPPGPWHPLRDRAAVALPVPALPAALPPRAALTIVRGGDVAAANGLRCALADLARWIDDAAEVRMRGLRFAANARGDAFVHGTPLPPLAGTPFVVAAGIALPAGHRFEPAVPPAIVAAHLALMPDDVALCSAHGAWVVLRAEHFVALTRSAVRTTTAELARG